MTASRSATGSAPARRPAPGTRPSTTRPVDAVTRVLPDGTGDLVGAIPAPTGVLAFVSGGEGLVGWGEHARLTITGPGAADRIAAWFADVVDGLRVRDEVAAAGSGPVAFVSLGFEDDDESVAVVPSVVLGRRGGVTFSTSIGTPPLAAPVPVRSPGQVRYSDGALSAAGYAGAVRAALARIAAGEVDKVVLARDLHARTERPVDERHLLARLAAGYPSCWTYAVGGLVGASPEMLVRRHGRTVTSRVLAGTAWPGGTGASSSAALMTSSKNLSEHGYAVASVARALGPVTETLAVPDVPHPLVLANLTHLATDVTGTLIADAPGALALAASLHPTAAVGGAPAAAARRVIRELEPVRRTRYAAPVGWLDTHGDGEFAIALRCGQVSGTSVRLFAGCGIVAGSDPAVEARESQVKMLPIREALEG
ncbi:isochorismate synthase [Nakamurella endophytica]|uniref:isochorismate synthase n=1 Tax=Nakamurella endophytica TaxID=1748367 RepID=A0A917WH89_9ACTN|nr:isochorismate synthase [Nakamurella endophytica]GGM03842.1 isochorismate synthase [Nakamurella endophytica]